MKTRTFTKQEFLQRNEDYGFVNMVTHETDEQQTIILDDIELTKELRFLKRAVKRFEKMTNLEITLE